MSKIDNIKYHFAKSTQGLTNLKALMLGVALSSLTIYGLDDYVDDFNDTTNHVSREIAKNIQKDINSYARLDSDIALLKELKITNITEQSLDAIFTKKNTLEKSFTNTKSNIVKAAFTSENLTEKDFQWLSNSFYDVTGKGFGVNARGLEEARESLKKQNKELTVRNVTDVTESRNSNNLLIQFGGALLPVIFTYLACLCLYFNPRLKKLAETKPVNKKNKLKIN